MEEQTNNIENVEEAIIQNEEKQINKKKKKTKIIVLVVAIITVLSAVAIILFNTFININKSPLTYVPTHIKRTFALGDDDEFSIEAFIKYNRDGLIEEFSEYDVDSDSKTQRSIFHFEYDKNGNLIKMFGSCESDTFKYESKYEYENGLLSKETSGTATILYSYNENGQCISKTATYSGGLAIQCNKYEYNDSGKLIREYSIYTHSFDYKENEYDTNGNLKPFTWGEIIKTIEYTYDANGNEIKRLSLEKQGYNCTYSTTEKIYDENNKLIESTKNCTNTIPSDTKCEYKYDIDGKLMQIDITDSLPNEYAYEFAYDTNGNLLKQIEKYGDSDWEFTLREYSYEQIRTTYDKIAPIFEIIRNYSLVLPTSDYMDLCYLP